MIGIHASLGSPEMAEVEMFIKCVCGYAMDIGAVCDHRLGWGEVEGWGERVCALR